MFQVYASMDQRMPLSEVAVYAQRAEALGFDGLNVPEAVHDGLLAATLALHATKRLKVATSVLVAFPRSPMTVALAAWDLQSASGGRFELGLGAQVRGNIVDRYGTSWTPPVPRMREYIQSLRAIFACWQHGTPLAFEGRHYRFTRMQPFFNPGPIEHPGIPILLGGIGPGMLALAGEVADGLMTHPTNTAPRYLREVVWPNLERGAARRAHSGERPRLMVGGVIATGPGPAQVREARERLRQLLGFLYTTPAYWRSLALFGWGDRGRELRGLAGEGRWSEMTAVVNDAMLDAFVPSAPYGEIADVLREWYAGLSTWITFPVPEDPAWDREAARVIAKLRA